jgi:hypothetical protein
VHFGGAGRHDECSDVSEREQHQRHQPAGSGSNNARPDWPWPSACVRAACSDLRSHPGALHGAPRILAGNPAASANPGCRGVWAYALRTHSRVVILERCVWRSLCTWRARLPGLQRPLTKPRN